MQLPITDDYLDWARGAGDQMRTVTPLYDLFSSSIAEPSEMLFSDMQRALTAGSTYLKQGGAWGNAALLAAIYREYNLPHDDTAPRVLLTSGASMAYILVAQALLQPGDHVLLEQPYYQPHLKVLQARGARITLLPRRAPDYAVDLAEAAALMTPATRLIVLTNPHNPSGFLLPDATFDALRQLAQSAGAHIVVDEIYHDFIARVPAARQDERCISISSLSKVYGLGALRIGWIIAAPELIARLRAVHVLFDNSSSALMQAAAAAAFERYGTYRLRAEQLVAQNRAVLLDWLANAGVERLLEGQLAPEGCLFFPRLCGISSTEAFARMLAAEHNTLVVPGKFFGAPGHVRMAFAMQNAAVLQAALERLAASLRTFDGLL